MLDRRSRILVIVAIVATAVLGVTVHRLQNSAGAMGGHISPPKLAWLLYTVLVWGMLCPILAFERSVSRPFRVLIGLFAGLMWVRVAAEIPMLYVWKNWRPPMGMVHDVVCALALAGGLVATRAAWWPPRGRGDRWMLTFTGVLIFSVLLECLYAGLFYHAVRGATTGSDGVWFAAEGDPRFALINRLTLICDVLLYSFLIAFLIACFGPRRSPEPAVSRPSATRPGAARGVADGIASDAPASTARDTSPSTPR